MVPLRSQSAFSLVELSIVLVILGLLTGGILGGQALIRAAELRSISADAQRYSTAIYTFRDKYFAIPGDMTNATRFWGFTGTAVAPGCVSNHGAAASSPGTCDGNGNGFLVVATTGGATGEAFQSWNQLALAGLIEGQYTGRAGNDPHPLSGSALHDYTFGVNSPNSRIGNVGWGFAIGDSSSGGLNGFARDYRNWLNAGGDDNAGADNPYLRTDEAWNIDTKMDDGLPAQGRVQILMGLQQNCTDTTDTFNFAARYQLSETATNRCSLSFQWW